MLENDTNPPSHVARDCWVITDGAAGNERQALALAQMLGLPARNLVLPLRAPWSWFAPRRFPGGRFALSVRHRGHLMPPWPGLAIGCGRAAALLTRLLPDLSNGTTRSVQILDPRLSPAHWDLVIAPRHDGLSGANVLSPLGSLNPIDDDWLASGREAFPDLGALPGPRVGVLLGGPRRGVPLDDVQAAQLARSLRARQQHEGGSVMLLASRRTPDALFAAVRAVLDGVPGVHWRDAADGPNPYPGVLGWADRLIVTPDSVNMLSEAAAVGVPVHTLDTGPLPDKLARFHAALRERGLLHDLDSDAPPPPSPLRETAAVAADVRRCLGL